MADTSKYFYRIPVRSNNPKEREWIIYNHQSGITSALKYMYTDRNGNHHLAVGRSYCSSKDTFSRKMGRNIALKRLRKNCEKAYGVNMFIKTTYEGYQEFNMEWPNGTILFQSGKLDILTDAEYYVFMDKIDLFIRRANEAQYLGTDVSNASVMEFRDVVNWNTDPVLSQQFQVNG